jgi:hypothetical protein
MIRSRCLILTSIEALTEVVNISTNSIEDADNTCFPTVKELVSSFRKDGLLEHGLSEKPVLKTVDEPAIEKSSYVSKLDLSNSETNSAKSTPGCLERRQYSLDTTISSSSIPAMKLLATICDSKLECNDSAKDKQEWEICDIIGKKVVNGEVYYLVEWSAMLMPEYKLRKARDLVARFEAWL